MKKTLPLLLIVLATTLFINGCKKNDATEDIPADPISSANLKTTISGIVLSESNLPLNGVTVTAYGKTALTNMSGVFLLKDVYVENSRCIVKFTKPGFFKRQHAFIPSTTTTYLKIVLMEYDQPKWVSSGGGFANSALDNSSVYFVSNSVVNPDGSLYTGNFNVQLRHLSPDNINFSFMIQGGDLAAKDSMQNEVILQSYGMLVVEITDPSGVHLQLGNNSQARISLPIAASQLASAPAYIPLWHFDESTSLWIQEGVAQKSGNNYVGWVSHFSWWNCDVPFERATIKGRVVDCNGNPVPNIVVTLSGYNVITNQNGVYNHWIPANMAMTAQVLSQYNIASLSSQLENIPPVSSSQIFYVPDLIVACAASVTGSLVNCSGLASGGLVILFSSSGALCYQYTSTGLFTIYTPSNLQLALNAIGDDGSLLNNIFTPLAPGQLNIGPLTLCDTSAIAQNSFVLDGNGFNNRLFVIDTISTHSGYGQQTSFLNTVGIDQQSHDTIELELNIDGYTVGSYPYDSTSYSYIDLYLKSPVNDHYMSYYLSTSQGIINVSSYDPVGGRMKAQFSGTLANISGGVVNVLNGRINVTRTH